MDAIDAELARAQEERRKVEEALAAGAPMAVSSVTFDTDLYGGGGADPDRFAGYDTSIPASEDAAAEDEAAAPAPRRLATYTGHAIAAADLPRSADGHDDGLGLPKRSQRIIDREDDYRRRRLNQIISPERHDPFAAGEATPDPAVRTYADVMCDAALQKKKEDLLREIAKKKKEEEERKAAAAVPEQPAATTTKRRNRWDQSQEGDAAAGAKKAKTSSGWDAPDATPGIGRWDATPGRVGDATPSARRNRWDETPTPGRMADADATPAAGDATPGATPSGCDPKAAWWCHANP
jgi:splicing factor 3B subunit 1